MSITATQAVLKPTTKPLNLLKTQSVTNEQAVLNPMNLFDMPLLWIHMLGRPAEGDLKRPFKVSITDMLDDHCAAKGCATTNYVRRRRPRTAVQK